MMPVFSLLNEKKSLREDHWLHEVETFSCPYSKGQVQRRLEIVE